MYAIVDEEVRYRAMVVDRADRATFTPLAWGWGKDHERVYSHGCYVEAHAPTFVPLDATFGRDRDRVFGGSRAIEADVATFRTLGDGYAVDARHAYYGEVRLEWMIACWTLETADPSSFHTLAHGWAIDRTHAYRSGMVVSDATPRTLVPLTRRLATDGERVFVGGRPLPADPATFRALDERYGVDASRVYHGDILANVIAPADRATFRVLGDDFAADERYAYWRGEVIAGIPPRSLRVISNSFATSAELVLYFYSGIHGTRRITADVWGMKPIILDGADPTTFRDCGDLYGADAKRAYYHSTPIELRGDARRFEGLGVRLARDDAAVYYENDIVEAADPASFRIFAPAGVARDRECWYVYNAYGEYPTITRVTPDDARAALDGGTSFDELE